MKVLKPTTSDARPAKRIVHTCGWLRRLDTWKERVLANLAKYGFSATVEEDLRMSAHLHVLFLFASHSIVAEFSAPLMVDPVAIFLKDTDENEVPVDLRFVKADAKTVEPIEDADFTLAVFSDESNQRFIVLGYGTSDDPKIREIGLAYPGQAFGKTWAEPSPRPPPPPSKEQEAAEDPLGIFA